jgi:hypothetical protein
LTRVTAVASPNKIVAHRRPARHSTGPRTAKGKARSKLNALTHGLAAKLPWVGAIDRDLDRLASAIAGPNPDLCRRHFAKIAAEAELEVRRVRAVRLSLLSTDSGTPSMDLSLSVPAATFVTLPRLDRYEQRVLSRRNRALRLL